MDLPKVLTELVETQNKFDAQSYAKCFSETAVVYDEGRTHNGRKEIEAWIDEANKNYRATMKPLSFETTEEEVSLKAEVKGDFPGSPLVLTYHIQIEDEQIKYLKVTG